MQVRRDLESRQVNRDSWGLSGTMRTQSLDCLHMGTLRSYGGLIGTNTRYTEGIEGLYIISIEILGSFKGDLGCL